MSHSRREFMTAAGLGAGGAMLLPWSGAAEATPPPPRWDREVDVVIVGSGLAGLAAAVEAHTAGASVLVLEKRAAHGGNSILSGGAYNAADPERQRAKGVEDSPEKHFQQTLAAGDFRGDPEKVRYLAEHALEGWTWLEGMGLELNAPVYQVYGALWPRSHDPRYKTITRGAALVAVLFDQVKKLRIPVLLEHTVTAIYREKPFEGRVQGVQVEAEGQRLAIKARRALVLAAGGFMADRSMRTLHDPRMAKLTVTGHEEATGECLRQALSVGAYLVGMDHIQCNPGAPPGRKLRVILHMEPAYFVTVGKTAERIVAEDARRDVIRDALLAQPDQYAYNVVDADGYAAQGKVLMDVATRGLTTGDAWRGDTLEDLARAVGIPAARFVESVKRYNEHVAAGKDPDFGKARHNLVHPIQKPPFWACYAGVSVHHTMGGVQTEGATCKVVDFWGKVIPGFYAAGEVTGGVHGANRVGGNAVADAVVFGRVAGRAAAREEAWG
jgi:flavocytochrome c